MLKRQKTKRENHKPVLLKEMVTLLSPVAGGVYVDCTFGLGGHASEIISSASNITLIAIDRDKKIFERVDKLPHKSQIKPFNEVFSNVEEIITKQCQLSEVNGILYDLGVSSPQLDEASYGFSFNLNGPLLMQMGKNSISAEGIINNYQEKKLADIIFNYGEEKNARKIAAAIIKARKTNPIKTTQELATIVRNVNGSFIGKIHPATRVFQAIRIEVNDELGELKTSLKSALNLLKIGGTICVISFHSLEDRIVKEFMQDACKDKTPIIEFSASNPITWKQQKIKTPVNDNVKVFEILTKKIITASDEEIKNNPRARSAKLRAIKRIQ